MVFYVTTIVYVTVNYILCFAEKGCLHPTVMGVALKCL